MPFEIKPGQGTLHKAEKANERAPDYTGQLNIEGKLYRLAGWIKEGKAGKWLSLSAEVPRASAGVLTTKGAVPAREAVDPDADIPF